MRLGRCLFVWIGQWGRRRAAPPGASDDEMIPLFDGCFWGTLAFFIGVPVLVGPIRVILVQWMLP